MKDIMKIFLSIMLTAVLAESLLAQDSTKKAVYYVSMNDVQENIVYETMDKTLNLTYSDRFGRQQDILLRLYDWKHDIIASLKLDKSLGFNSYTIELENVYTGWRTDEIYTAELRDERGRLYRLPFRLVDPPEDIGPHADILVNPLQIACDGVSPSITEFYAQIDGGRPPFTVQWFVLNSERNDFLYQPREEILEFAGRTSQISIDKTPAYYVVLYVKDACGNEAKKVVNLVCESEHKRINTIFLEQLVSPADKGVKAVQ